MKWNLQLVSLWGLQINCQLANDLQKQLFLHFRNKIKILSIEVKSESYKKYINK